ncbi:MAG: amino acid-binding protein [Halodesulfurarchaeum sp.]
MDDEHGPAKQAHTVRLELVDEPGELLRALEPIAEGGGNLLSIFHERGSVTPRGRIPVEIDLECAPTQFEAIIEALRDRGVNVIQAGTERYGEELSVLLIGPLIETDLSDTIEQIESRSRASVKDLSISGEANSNGVSSARFRLGTESDSLEDVLETVREIAAEKSLRVVEPLVGDR